MCIVTLFTGMTKRNVADSGRFQNNELMRVHTILNGEKERKKVTRTGKSSREKVTRNTFVNLLDV